MTLQATRDQSSGLADVIDRILDKGLVINADICVSIAGVELLGIKYGPPWLPLKLPPNTVWNSPAAPIMKKPPGKKPI